MTKEKPLFLTQGDAFNLWSAVGEIASKYKMKTHRDLEEKLRIHLNTAYPMIVKSDSLGGKRNEKT